MMTYQQLKKNVAMLAKSLNLLQYKATGKKEELLQKFEWLQNIQFDRGFGLGHELAQPSRVRNDKPVADIKLIRSIALMGGKVMKDSYIFIRPKAMTKKKFMEIGGRFSRQGNIAFPVKLSSGELQWRNIKPKYFKELAENNFHFTGSSIGSDADIQQEGQIDFTRPFASFRVVQRNQLPGACNSKKSCIRQLKTCVVTDPFTKHSNCFFQVLKHLKMKHDVLLVDQGPVTIEQALQICERNYLAIEFVCDELNNNGEMKSLGKTINAGMQRIPHQKIVFAMKKSMPHFYVFETQSETKQQGNDRKKQKKQEDKREEILVFYDLETVFNHYADNFAQTYSGAYLAINKTDFNQKITFENIESFLSKCQFLEGEDACSQMVNLLCAKYNSSEYKFKFISFNGANFDDYFLLDQAVKNGENVHATFQTKSILGLTFSYGSCWDLRKFLTIGSLDKLCTDFNVWPKKMGGFPHDVVQQAFENYGLQRWVRDNRQQLENYNKFDVLSLYSLTQKFRDIILNLTKTDVFDHLTIGGHSYNMCKGEWSKEQKLLLKAPITEEIDLFIRKCLTAGRCEIMGSKDGSPVHLQDKRLSMVDVVSLYPSVMINEKIFYPCGEGRWVMARDPSKLGFYKISVIHREDLPNVLPCRDYENATIPLNWKQRTKFDTYCTSEDLNVLKQYGHNFTVMNGYEFQDRISGDSLFSSLIPFKQEKIRQDVYKQIYQPAQGILYNQALREVCKIYLNSLSGKVIQRNFDNVVQIIRSQQELHDFLDKTEIGTAEVHLANQYFIIGTGKKIEYQRYQARLAKPSYLGVYIYAHARSFMYRNIFTQIDVQYTDTDSGLTTYEQELLLRKNREDLFTLTDISIDGLSYQFKDFGTLDCELDQTKNPNEAILLQAKNYLVGNRSESYFPKIKCKGVSFYGDSCKYVPYDLPNSDGQQVFSSLPDSLKSDPIRLFDDILKNGYCRVACQQFVVKSVRNVNYSTFGIALRYIVKTIKV